MNSRIANLNQVTATTLADAIRDSVELGHCLMIWGSFGLGKTQIVRQVLGEMGYELIDWFRGSQATPDTVAGIPYLQGGRLERAAPELVVAIEKVIDSGKRPAVFLDEINLSSQSLLAALLQFLLDRKLGNFDVPQDMPIIAAGNLETDGSLVTPMPLPAANRMAHVLYTGPTIEEWTQWAIGAGVHHLVVGFLKDRPQWLASYSGEASTDEWRVPTPRTWEFASQAMHLLDRRGSDDPVVRMAMLSRYIGDACAAEMETHIAYSRHVVPLHDVVKEPERAPMPNFDNAGVRFMQIHALISGAADDDRTKAIVTYVKRWPEDAAAQFMIYLIKMAPAAVRRRFAKHGLLRAKNISTELLKEVGNLSGVLGTLHA